MRKLKVLIVDDTIVYRKVLADCLAQIDAVGVINTASNGELALERLDNESYDLILLDNIMPGISGLDTLRIIKAKKNAPEVIMVSGTSGESGELTLKALELGALDFIVKPMEARPEKNIEKLTSQLFSLITQVRLASLGTTSEAKIVDIPKSTVINTSTQYNKSENSKSELPMPDIIAIAASTGGPVAIKRLLLGMRSVPLRPIFIVQHMPQGFTSSMAKSLSKDTGYDVVEAQDGDVIKSGTFYLAPGGYHMHVVQNQRAQKVIKLDISEMVNGVRPSADVLFSSLAREYLGGKVLAVILTGMGNDGTQGVKILKTLTKTYAIAQDEQTSVVYGMPRCLVEEGLADEVASIDNIAGRFNEIFTHKDGS